MTVRPATVEIRQGWAGVWEYRAPGESWAPVDPDRRDFFNICPVVVVRSYLEALYPGHKVIEVEAERMN